MFCYQCEQTSKGTGCTVVTACGKDPETAALQDLLVYATKGVSMYAVRAGQLGARSNDVDVFVIEALFTTVTNVNFDHARMRAMLLEAARIRDGVRALYEAAAAKAGQPIEKLSGQAAWQPAETLEGLIIQGQLVTI